MGVHYVGFGCQHYTRSFSRAGSYHWMVDGQDVE